MRGAHTAGIAARLGGFALLQAPSTTVALDLIQLQPPWVKTDLTFCSTPSCRICTLKGLWSSPWHHSCWFLLPSFVVEHFTGLEEMDLFLFFWAVHFGHLSKGLEHREKPSAFSFRQLWSLAFTHCHYNRVGNVHKAAACPVTPSTNPGMSVLLHSSSWLLLPSSEFWCCKTSLTMKELKLFFFFAHCTHYKLLRTSINVSQKGTKIYFVQNLQHQKPSHFHQPGDSLSTIILPLSVSRYIC